MELSKKIIGALVLLGLTTSCTTKEVSSNTTLNSTTDNEVVLQHEDFTEMGIFTDGIEGPAIDSNGDLFIVNFSKQGVIGKVTKDGQAEVYLTLPQGSIGNSIQFDQQNNMYVADYIGHNIYKISPSKNIDTLIHHEKFTQPNDIAITTKGLIYASDPNWSNNTGQLWLIKNGVAILQEGSMGTTNGIVLSNDEKKLYVNESVQRRIWVYDVAEDGQISNKTLFHQFEEFGMDGMKFDGNDNLHIARYGAGMIAVLSPQGNQIKEYKLRGKNPTNLVFSKDGTTIFVTMQIRRGVEKIMITQ